MNLALNLPISFVITALVFTLFDMAPGFDAKDMKNHSKTIKIKLLGIIQWSLKDIYLTIKVHDAILYGFSAI